MKSRWKTFGDVVLYTLLILLGIMMITELVQDIITQTKIEF